MTAGNTKFLVFFIVSWEIICIDGYKSRFKGWVMKKRYLKWICVAAAVCITALALLGAAENTDVSRVKELLEKRTSVMENVLFGNITYEQGKEQLRQVEKDKLYNDDLRALSQYKNTDIESVWDMDITELKKESRIYDIMTFSCRIKWTCSGTDGTSEDTYDYIVGVDVNGGDHRLVSFELKEN